MNKEELEIKSVVQIVIRKNGRNKRPGNGIETEN